MKYAEVAVFSHTKKNFQTFSYQIPQDLISKAQKGQLVKVPFRSRSILGIILAISNKKPAFKGQVKEIQEIVFLEPILIPHLLKIVPWLSEYYFASLISVLETLIPKEIIIKREQKKELPKSPSVIAQPIKKQKPELLLTSLEKRKDVYLKEIQKTIKSNKGVIFLVPDLDTLYFYQKILVQEFKIQPILWHSLLQTTERRKKWLAIFTSKNPVVIGTRGAMFAPIKNLGLIIIDEEQNESYKQDQTPRYHVVNVAEKIIENNHIKLILGSNSPSLDAFYKTKTGDYNLKNLTVKKKLEVEIVDLNQERLKKNFSYISEKLKEGLEETFVSKNQAILFLNRRGFARAIICRDCGLILKCPHCQTILTYHKTIQILICHHCNHQEAMPIWCPKCQGVMIKLVGTGTQKLEEELKSIFPKVSIARIDKDVSQEKTEKIINDFQNKKVDILIGTKMIFKKSLPKIALLAFVLIDNELAFSDFRATERTIDILSRMSDHLGSNGKIIIQTENPENPFIKSLQKFDILKVIEKELILRKEFELPPYTKLIKLTYSAKKENQKETEKLAQKIRKAGIDISPPISLESKKEVFKDVMLVKIKKMTKDLKMILDDLDYSWSIDIDPQSLL